MQAADVAGSTLFSCTLGTLGPPISIAFITGFDSSSSIGELASIAISVRQYGHASYECPFLEVRFSAFNGLGKTFPHDGLGHVKL